MYNIDGAQHQQPFLRKFVQMFLMLFINRYASLQKIDNLVINGKLRTVEFLSNQTLQPVLQRTNGTVKSLTLNNREFERFNLILKERKSSTIGLEEKVLKNMQDLNDNFESLKQMMLQNMKALDVLLNQNKRTS